MRVTWPRGGTGSSLAHCVYEESCLPIVTHASIASSRPAGLVLHDSEAARVALFSMYLNWMAPSRSKLLSVLQYLIRARKRQIVDQ